jgi:hypothetical protein
MAKIEVTLLIGGQPLVAELDDDAIAAIAAALEASLRPPEPPPEFLTIPEAAILLGCGYLPCDRRRGKPCAGENCRRCHGTGRVVNRGRVDSLLSAGLIERTKEGDRTLIRRSAIDAYLDNGSNRRRRR